jgi:hypothetical protein
VLDCKGKPEQQSGEPPPPKPAPAPPQKRRPSR